MWALSSSNLTRLTLNRPPHCRGTVKGSASQCPLRPLRPLNLNSTVINQRSFPSLETVPQRSFTCHENLSRLFNLKKSFHPGMEREEWGGKKHLFGGKERQCSWTPTICPSLRMWKERIHDSAWNVFRGETPRITSHCWPKTNSKKHGHKNFRHWKTYLLNAKFIVL